MDFREKIKKALEPEKGFNFKQNSKKASNLNMNFNVATLNFIDNQEGEYIDLFKSCKKHSTEYYPYFNFIVSEEEKKVCSFTIYGLTHLSNIAFLNASSPLPFYNVEDVIYMDCSNVKNINEVKRMFSSVKLLFRDWNIEIYTVLGNKRKEMLFFDGKKFLCLLPRKIIFSEEKVFNYFEFTNLKHVPRICGLCEIKEYKFIIEENPIIPKRYNRVCKDCIKIIEKNNTH